MCQKSKEIAEHASLQTFLNTYIYEVKGEKWLDRSALLPQPVPLNTKKIVVVNLPKHQSKLAAEVRYRSLVGRHKFGRIFRLRGTSWEEIEPLDVMMSLCQELHVLAGLCSHYDELLYRLLDSCQTMTKIVGQQLNEDPAVHPKELSFIKAEQSLRYGHWMHPTPKSRQGMSGWQQEMYSPELSGEFPLHYFAVNKKLIKEGSAEDLPASELVKDCLDQISHQQEEIIFPMHPLQAQWLLQQPWVIKAMQEGLIKNAGTSLKPFAATSSLRTVFQEGADWMLKFSIPVKVTNSLRVNKYHELEAGVVMASLLKKREFESRFDAFSIINDSAYLTVQHEEMKESGFEVILRHNPFNGRKGVMPVAALVQGALPGEKTNLTRLIEFIQRHDQTVEEASMQWFKTYWNHMIEPMITLYEEDGIALEAHQQNCVVDVSAGYPIKTYFRDNQGYYLANSYREQLLACEPGLADNKELFYEEKMIQDRFTYYVLMNHLFSVIHRFGEDGLIQESVLLEWVKNRLFELEAVFTGAGKRWIQYVLHALYLPCKANLLTRLQDVDELEAENEQAVYISVPNPFTKEASADGSVQRRTARLQTVY